MATPQSFITLDSCITDYLDESEQSIHKYKKLFNIAFRGMDNMGIDFFYQIQSFKLTVNANFTVNLPSNCLNVVKVGVLNGAGEVIPLYTNNKLTTYADLVPNRVQETQDNTVFDWNITVNGGLYYNYWWNGGYMNLYGLPSGGPFVGSFTHDTYNNILVLNEDYLYDYVIVECLVSPIEGNEYYVPTQFREALIAWMAWMDIRSMPASRKGNLGDKRDRRSEFYNQRRLAIAQYSPFRIEEAYQASQEQTRMCIKG